MIQNDIYADPTLDWSFKRIFLSPGHDVVLKAFLNDVLEGDLVIEHIESSNSLEKPTSDGKRIIYDIKAKSDQGEEFIIEMQREAEPSFLKRLEYYRCRAYSGQISSAIDYDKLLPVIVIAMCEFPVIKKIIGEDSDKYFDKIYYYAKESRSFLKQPPHIVLLDLPKYEKMGFPKNSYLEDWFQLFTCRAIPDGPRVKRAEVKKALDDLVRAKLTEEELMDIEKEGLDKKVLREELRYAVELGQSEGLAKGLAEGRAKGLAEGLAEGLAKGLADAKRENALRFLKKGVPVEIVAECTGLTLDEVTDLKNL